MLTLLLCKLVYVLRCQKGRAAPSLASPPNGSGLRRTKKARMHLFMRVIRKINCSVNRFLPLPCCKTSFMGFLFLVGADKSASCMWRKVTFLTCVKVLSAGEAVSNAGIVESITLKNFMCHSHLGPFAFGSNVNFVVGNNGSECNHSDTEVLEKVCCGQICVRETLVSLKAYVCS